MNWRRVALAIGGLFLGLILASTLFSVIAMRKRGTCPAVSKGQEILRKAEEEDTQNSEDYL